MTDDMTAQQAAALREPFPPEAIGKLPKAGTQLDYVGHAAVTDRLLKVDPGWSWEPFALAEDGGPLIRRGANDAELWILLTVCGMTRPGVGTAPLKAFDLSKQLISDAIRNAAMRFGVALDLWAKEDLHSDPPVEPASEAQLDTIRTAVEALAEGRRSELSETWKQRGYGALTGQPFPLAASDAPAVLALIAELQAKADGTVDETGRPLTDEPF
jgi:hypothetical protein